MAAAMLGAGCAQLRYSQYTGQQSWPTTAGTMADKDYAVPVYSGWPERPYKVMGSIRFANPGGPWQDGDTSRAASLARSKGGDAIIKRYGGEFGVGAIAGASADAHIVSVNQVTALVIKWKPDIEIARDRAAFERFQSDFIAKHPDLQLRNELVKVGADYITSLGLTLDSASGSAELDKVLSEVLQPVQSDKPTKWLFRGSIRSSGVTSSFTEPAFGLATVTLSGDSITVVSAPGRTELHLSGTVKDGRLVGQVGVSSGSIIFSGKAEGVVVPGRISLDSQGQTADGIVQSSLTLMR